MKAQGSRSYLRLALGASLILFSLVLGSTFAANINLNNNQAVEFGQGLVQTVACDEDGVTLTPYSSFVNEDGGGSFKFTSLTVTGISSQCSGKVFTIKAYKKNQDNPLVLYTTGGTPYSQLQIADNNGVFTFVEEVTGLQGDDIQPASSDGFTVNLSTEGPPPSEAGSIANDVDRITIESREGSGASPSPSPSASESGNGDSIPSAGTREIGRAHV